MANDSRLDLAALREQIRSIDEQMIRLSAERVELARLVGKIKLDHNLPVKDYKVEKDIIEKARVRARELGVYEQLIEDVLKLQIKYSVFAQEEFHSHARQSSSTGKRILIVGGLGKMGLWLAQFFEAFGHSITIYDHHHPDDKTREAFKVESSLSDACRGQDFIVLATPISQTGSMLSELIRIKPEGIVFDICSLKTPILPQIMQAGEAGLRVSSIHPMFGPNTDMLAGKNIVFCEHGDPALSAQVQSLFDGTPANLIRVGLHEHDNLMSIVLGLSHFLNLSFAKTLADSTIASSDLQRVASSTFRSQLDVTIPVVCENQDLYYEIQVENGHTKQIVKSLMKAMQDYLTVISNEDRGTFKQYMNEAKRYLAP